MYCPWEDSCKFIEKCMAGWTDGRRMKHHANTPVELKTPPL